MKASSFHRKAKLLNDKRYTIDHFPPTPLHKIERVNPMKHCLAAGNELPVLVRYKPGEDLKTHWIKWLPFLPEAETRDLVTENTGDKQWITSSV